jgi:hypothetical protein
MSRTVIQIGDDRVAYDGRDWTPVSGERAEELASMMKASEFLYNLKASSHPDYAYNMACAAAEDFHGQIVEYQPGTPPPEGPGIFY